MEYYNPYSGAVYYGGNDYRDYVAHYGVKGMKWGKHLPGVLAALNKVRSGAQDFYNKRITGSYYKNEANRQSDLSARYGNMAKKSMSNWKNPHTSAGKHTANSAFKAQSDLAKSHGNAAAEAHRKYTQSVGYKVGQALHQVKRSKAYKAASSAAKKTISSIRSGAKKLASFGSSVLNAGRNLVKKVATKVGNAYRVAKFKHQQNQLKRKGFSPYSSHIKEVEWRQPREAEKKKNKVTARRQYTK